MPDESSFHPRFLRIPRLATILPCWWFFSFTLVRLLGPGGVRSIVAESLLVGLLALLLRPTRLLRWARPKDQTEISVA